MEFSTAINEETGEPIVNVDVIRCFYYEAGYAFEATDLGIYNGVKITMTHPQEQLIAVLFPPEKTEELGLWLLKSMGQTVPQLPKNLGALLKRVVDSKGQIMPIKRGDKNMAKEAIKVLKWSAKGA